IIVAQVTIRTAGTEVHPLAHVAMTEKTVVVLIAVALHNAGFDFSADAALRTDCRARADFAAQDVRARSDRTRSLQPREGGDHSVPANTHRPRARVGHHHRLHPGRAIDVQLFLRTEDAQRAGLLDRTGAALGLVIERDLFAILLDKFPQVVHEKTA